MRVCEAKVPREEVTYWILVVILAFLCTFFLRPDFLFRHLRPGTGHSLNTFCFGRGGFTLASHDARHTKWSDIRSFAYSQKPGAWVYYNDLGTPPMKVFI
jgi:hypothetical protein